MTKTCTNCQTEKPLSEFYANAEMADGRLGQCKACVKARVAAHRLRNVDAIRENDRRRAGLPHRREHLANTSKRWNEAHPERRRAVVAAGNALRDGRLTRAEACEAPDCDDRTRRPQMHHDDYGQPLAVRWLCKPCHWKADAARRRAESAREIEA